LSDNLRRLAAIVFTDIVGYTALTQRDESLALKLLEQHKSLLRSFLKRYGGREVKTVGDAFLLEFDSALEAVLCSVEIQDAFRERNESISEKILIRIGIHVGDVIFQNNDIYGDTVNIASRIVQFAEPGGVCISEQVFVQVRNKVRQQLVRLPKQKLKNVELKTDLYQVVLPWQTDIPETRPIDKKNRIAVLPFTNISPDPGDSYFSDGLTEELISALSEIQGLRVIARTSVNRFRGGAKDVTQIGDELQVSFILEGSVRKSGNKIRVATQLIDVATQEHAWSNQYDRNLDDVFMIQSDIAKSVADSLKVTLRTGEKARIEEKKTENVSAYVAYLKGRALLHDRSEKAIKGAKEQFELAIKEDPTYARAYAGLADIHILLGDYLFSPVPESLEEARYYVKKALDLDPGIAEARVSLAETLMYEYKFREAEREFRKAIALNPSYATAHHWYANCLTDFGRVDEAYLQITLAEELDPLSSVICLSAAYASIVGGKEDEARKRLKKLSEIDPSSPLVNEGYMTYHFAKGEWDETMKYLDKMREADPSDPYLDADVAYIYAVTGRQKEALELVEKLKRVIPENSGTKSSLIAFVYAGFDGMDQVFSWLERGLQSREIFFGWFRRYPIFENVRRDPRFNELLKKADLL
jgi:adenylate cyclase